MSESINDLKFAGWFLVKSLKVMTEFEFSPQMNRQSMQFLWKKCIWRRDMKLIQFTKYITCRVGTIENTKKASRHKTEQAYFIPGPDSSRDNVSA